MTKKESYYLTIHFRPNVACIVVDVCEAVFNQLHEAISRHRGEIELQTTHYISTIVEGKPDA